MINFTRYMFASLLLLCVAFLGGRSGGGSTPASVTTSGKNSLLTAVHNTAPLVTCVNGGISVDVGIDTNGNGLLGASEVISTQYVCKGATVTTGTAGTTKLNALVTVTTEPIDANCTNGGNKVSVGTDTNGDRILESSEITSSNYVCNGANGTNGVNGFTTLVSIVTEPAGANCANRGYKITSGLDANNSAVLDAGEVSTTNYVCNDAIGTTGTTGATAQQAQPDQLARWAQASSGWMSPA